MLRCVHSYNRRSRAEYTMPCLILKHMPDRQRVKVLVFGERWNSEVSKTRVRYVTKDRVSEMKSR